MKKLMVLLAFAPFLASQPGQSCDTYAYSYSNSSAMQGFNYVYCGGTGGTCIATGACGGAGTHCVDDGIDRFCIDYQY